nr:unnamed protein product [Digitaria exilis]
MAGRRKRRSHSYGQYLKGITSSTPPLLLRRTVHTTSSLSFHLRHHLAAHLPGPLQLHHAALQRRRHRPHHRYDPLHVHCGAPRPPPRP